MVVWEVSEKTGWDIDTRSIGDRHPEPFLRTRFDERGGQFSPDGRWIAYISDETGADEV